MRYNIDEVIYMKKGILSLSLLAVSILALTSCNAPIKIKSQSGEFSIHSEHQELYLNDVNYNNITKHAAFASLENYANSLPITLSWSGGMSPYTLSISENEDLSDAYQVKVSKSKSIISFLKSTLGLKHKPTCPFIIKYIYSLYSSLSKIFE